MFSEIKPINQRTVSHLPGGIDCTNCYETNTFPCTSCKEVGEVKENIMGWDTFKEATPSNVFIERYGKVPDNYEEFCLLRIKKRIYKQIPVRVHTQEFTQVPTPCPTPESTSESTPGDWNEIDLR